MSKTRIPSQPALRWDEQRICLVRVLRVAAGRGLWPVDAHEDEVLPDRHVPLRPAAFDVGDQAGGGRLRDVDKPEAVVAALDQRVAPEGHVRVEEVERMLILRQGGDQLQLVRVAVRERGGVGRQRLVRCVLTPGAAATAWGCSRGTGLRRSRTGWPPPRRSPTDSQSCPSRSFMQSRRPPGRSFRLAPMPARFHLLHAGYIRDSGVTVGSSVSLIEDDGALIVVDPGLVAMPDAILGPLAALGHAPSDVTHVVLTHHHPDHTVNVALFPKADVVDAWAHYRGRSVDRPRGRWASAQPARPADHDAGSYESGPDPPRRDR